VRKVVAVTPRDAFFDIKEEMNHINLTAQTTSFILEPFRRNTAASVATAALHIAQLHSEDALVLVLPSGHLPVEQDAFQNTISVAMESALSGKLIAFGMRTYKANTKYSWAANNDKESQASFQWNSSLFLFKAGSMLKAMREHCPDVLSTTSTCLKHSELIEENNHQKLELNPSTFCNVLEGSLNEVVIKKSNQTTVMLCDLNWLDHSPWG
jgi:mannose-1-phosphate guanylyltransferase